jgi:hypothetical protein
LTFEMTDVKFLSSGLIVSAVVMVPPSFLYSWVKAVTRPWP